METIFLARGTWWPTPLTLFREATCALLPLLHARFSGAISGSVHGAFSVSRCLFQPSEQGGDNRAAAQPVRDRYTSLLLRIAVEIRRNLIVCGRASGGHTGQSPVQCEWVCSFVPALPGGGFAAPTGGRCPPKGRPLSPPEAARVWASKGGLTAAGNGFRCKHAPKQKRPSSAVRFIPAFVAMYRDEMHGR